MQIHGIRFISRYTFRHKERKNYAKFLYETRKKNVGMLLYWFVFPNLYWKDERYVVYWN